LELRRFPAALLLIALLAGCAGRTDEVLPIAPSLKGASHVRGVEVIVRQTAPASAGALDARIEARPPAAGGDAALPFEQLLTRMIQEVTREAGLTAGRALRLVVEVDSLKVANAGTAFFGADDELAGSVFIRDAETAEELGQLYVRVGRANGGAISVLARGGGVRERLAEAFAHRIAGALDSRKPRR
jgi:hypothetical protein